MGDDDRSEIEVPEEPLLLPDEVCAWLRVSKKNLYALVARGAIPHLRVGKHLRFERAALTQWLAGGALEEREP